MKTRIQKMFVGLLVLFPAVAGAESQVPPTALAKPMVIQLTLHPAPLVGLPFRYRLLPDLVDLEPGNAAPLYMIASELMAGSDTKENTTVIDELEGQAADKIDRDRANAFLERFRSPLRHVELGARREYCTWDLPVRSEGFGTLLPYLKGMRTLSRLIALQAKIQVADGRYDAAVHTLQTGFGLARHLDQDAFLIQELVAAAVTESMLGRVEQWIAKPGSPNLYWTLSDLPAPYLDIRSSVRHERAGTFWSIPHLKEAIDGKLTAEHYGEMSKKLQDLYAVMGKIPENRDNPPITVVIGDAIAQVQKAKAALHEMGYTDKTLEALTPEQRMGLWWGQSYERAFEETTKALALPFYQDPTMIQGAGGPEKARKPDPSNPMMELLPTISHARLSVSRVDRHIGQLRCLEMIRAYAAGHDGAAPETLAAIPGIPVAVDPATGLPYQYHSVAGAITLEAPVPAGGQPRYGWKVEIKLEK